MSESDQSDLPQIRMTGHPEVDAALERLGGLAERPVAEHGAEFEAISAALRDALDEGAPESPS